MTSDLMAQLAGFNIALNKTFYTPRYGLFRSNTSPIWLGFQVDNILDNKIKVNFQAGYYRQKNIIDKTYENIEKYKGLGISVDYHFPLVKNALKLGYVCGLSVNSYESSSYKVGNKINQFNFKNKVLGHSGFSILSQVLVKKNSILSIQYTFSLFQFFFDNNIAPTSPPFGIVVNYSFIKFSKH
ncbi:MAG: hypothetical protein IT244_11800 [Bacteroidia bacterium]|nr:hypothetical protein [Bacteroidia bacterium]